MKAFVPLLAKAMRDHGDSICIRMVYTGEDGVRKRRFVSPYGFTSLDDSSFYGLCLTTGELREFMVDRCSEVIEWPAHDVLIPMPMETVE